MHITYDCGWMIRVTPDTDRNVCIAEILDHGGVAPDDLDPIEVEGLSVSKAEDIAIDWTTENPRHAMKIDAMEHGYAVRVTRRGDLHPIAESVRADHQSAEQWACKIIDYLDEREARLYEAEIRLAIELAGKQASIYASIAELEGEKKRIGQAIKSLEERIRDLAMEARSPQLNLELDRELLADKQQRIDFPADDQRDENGAEHDDDEPVADANGKHRDGPKRAAKKTGKRKAKKTAKRKAARAPIRALPDPADLVWPDDDATAPVL